MSRSTILVAIAVVAIAAGIGYYLWSRHASAGPPPPAIPEGLTDPPARKMVEQKRLAVLAALHSGTAWGELAMSFDAHEASAEAIACYRRAMDLDPKDGRWPFLLAGQLKEHGAGADKEEAVQLYRRAADCSPRSSDYWATALLTLADLLTELGRASEAAPLYQQVYDEDPSNPWAAYRMGVVLADRGETEKATKILLGLAGNPFANRKAAIALAELNRRAGRAKDADGFEYAASLLPPDNRWMTPFDAEVFTLWRGRRALVSTYVAQEGARNDRVAVRTATALADQYPSVETQMMLLRALVSVGEYRAAVAVADDMLRDEGGRRLVNAHTSLGVARIGLADRAEVEGRKDDADRLLAQAVEAFGESVRLQSDFALGHIYRAKALLRLGKLPQAEEAARAGVSSRPEEWQGYLVLSDVLAASGRKAEAVAAAELAVKLAHPNEPRPKKALEALQK